MKICKSVGVFAFALAAPFAGSAYGETGICGDGKLYTTDAGRQVTYVDVHPEGVSIGDQRIGKKDMLDSDGQKVGVFRWVATVMELGASDGDKPIYSVQKIYELEDGMVFGSSIDNTKSPVGDTSMPSIVSGQTTIYGGVGKYAGANGIKRHERHPDTGAFTYSFEIDCP